MDEVRVVQFLHPGREHRPDKNGWVQWNRGPHGRKFVECRGAYVQSLSDCRRFEGRLHFWTEWEAESRLIRELPEGPSGGPRYLFEPHLREKQNYAGLCNTDPCVFDGFCYCICQQRGTLKKLDRGSVILFGSRLKHRFVLDTVFVVDRWQEYSTTNHQHLATTSEYRAVGLAPILEDADPMSCRGERTNERYRLYHGATFQHPVAGMFSYFPCLPAQPSDGFRRPKVQISRIISDNQAQGYHLSGPFSPEVAAKHWQEVVDQVLQQRLALGVAAEMPALKSGG